VARSRKPVPGPERETRSARGERTRGKIKAAARRLLKRKLPGDLLLDDICDAAGVTIGAFYWYFKTKEAVIEEVAVDVIGELYAQFEAIPETSGLDATLYAVNAVMLTQPDLRQLRRTVQMLLQTSPQVAEAWWTQRRALVARLAALVAAARAEAGLPRIDAAATVDFLLAGVEGVYDHRVRGLPTTAPGDSPDAWARKLAKVWRRAVLARDPEPRTVVRASMAAKPLGRPKPARRSGHSAG